MNDDAQARRLARAEANELAFQDHNARRAEIEGQAGTPSGEQVSFICECDDPGCFSPLELSVAEYERAVAPPGRFAVVPGHEDLEVEVVVERHRAYIIVSKPDLTRPGRPVSG